MPSRRSGGGGTVRRKRSLGNLRRAHPASGAEWNVQVVRGKMSSKCLWHACRALILGLTLMLLGAGMATIGYYADYLSMGPELRSNATVRVKNDLKGFHLSNFSYVGPIVMGFGGFIVVASCVMTFEARDSAAKVVPARLRAVGTGSKKTMRSNQSSSASQRRAIGMQLQSSRWDQHFGVFRSSPAEPPISTETAPFDRDMLTAELIKFSKSLSASARFSPQLRRLTYGSVPNLSTTTSTHASHSQHHQHVFAYSTNLANLLSPHHKTLLLEQHKRYHRHNHHHRHRHHRHTQNSVGATGSNSNNIGSIGVGGKVRGTRISNSLIQRNTRDHCALLQLPANRLFWHTASFDESGRLDRLRGAGGLGRVDERTRRSETAKRHQLARQKPIEHQEQEEDRQHSPLGNRRRCSTMSDSSYSGRWTVRCASIASHTSSIDSRRIQVDLHSPEVIPKSILRSPKRHCAVVSTTPSVEKEFRSQLSVCSEPPAPVRQLSGQSSLEPCFPEENVEISLHDKAVQADSNINLKLSAGKAGESAIFLGDTKRITTSPPETPIGCHQPSGIKFATKKPRPNSLSLVNGAAIYEFTKAANDDNRLLRSNSSRTFYRPKPQQLKEFDDSIFYIRSSAEEATGCTHDFYDSLQVINERRRTLLKADSETMLLTKKADPDVRIDTEIPVSGTEKKMNNFLLTMQETPEATEVTALDIDAEAATER